MGACASKPKNLDLDNKPAPEPVPAPGPAEAPAVPVSVPQEKEDGGETKKEEPLIDISEPATPETPKIEEVITTEPKVTIEEVLPVEAPKATEAKDGGVEPAKVIETVEKPAAEVAAPKS